MAEFNFPLLSCILFALFIVLSPAVLSATLQIGFYEKTCPLAEAIVRSTVKKALANDTGGVPAALVRPHFHDCFGCDGSILIDSTPTNEAEKDSPAELGIGGFDAIDAAKAQLESVCPNTVSCADIVAFGSRDGVLIAGGFYYDVPAGRRDGTVSSATEATENLPGPFFNVSQLKDNFASKGLSLEEVVILSGAHSIGDSHCASFSKRLYSFNATYSQDPSLDPDYAKYLMTKRPRPSNTNDTSINTPVVPFDALSPTRLDNNYHKELKAHKGLLFSDQVLWDTPSTHTFVQSYINNPGAWASKFTEAMLHMGYIEVLTGSQGQIRKNCITVNSS